MVRVVWAIILGFFTRHFFEGHAIYALVLGGISMIIAGFLTLLVTDKKG